MAAKTTKANVIGRATIVKANSIVGMPGTVHIDEYRVQRRVQRIKQPVHLEPEIEGRIQARMKIESSKSRWTEGDDQRRRRPVSPYKISIRLI